MTEGPFTNETTVLEAMARYRWLVLLIILAFGSIGLVFSLIRAPGFDAVATLFLEEPAESSIVGSQDGTTRQFGQFLAEQEALIQSTITAKRSAEIADNEALSVESFLEGTRTASDVDTGRISISFTSSTPSSAIDGANALASAYQEVRLEQIRESAGVRAGRVEAALALVADDLVSVRSDIEEALPAERSQLDEQLDDSLAELVALRILRSRASGDQLEAIRAQLDDLFLELQVSNLYRSLEEKRSDLAPLLKREADLLDLEQELSNRRQLALIEGELADPGVSLFSEAQRARQRGIALVPLVIVMAILGIVAGGFLAYYLALRKRRVLNSRDPQLVLRSPLLAEVPLFSEERVRSQLPVEDYPESGVAEAYRFLASSIVVRQMARGDLEARHSTGTANADRARLLVFVSATLGDGKTTTAANTALAAARAGNKVLAIDGDFSSQELMRLLSPNPPTPGAGLTEVVLAGETFEASVLNIERRSAGQLDAIGRGNMDVTAATFFRDERVAQLFSSLKSEYDLVIIDTPPMLQVAYTSLLVRLADVAVVLVRHDCDIAELEELQSRLAMSDTPVIGYTYNGAPLRRRLSGPEGSYGDEGFQP